jgi:hypothetical protein
MNICDFRDLIFSLIDSKIEGFEKWQDMFSKVIEKLMKM